MKAKKNISIFKKKFFSFFAHKLVLNKIRLQFARHEKIRIATNYFVLILGSFLMLLSFFVPSILFTFLYGTINSVKPYNSYVKYQSIPWNDFHGNMVLGKIDGNVPTKDNWQHAGLPTDNIEKYPFFSDDEKQIYGFLNPSPIYSTFLPASSKNFKENNNFFHYLGPEKGKTKDSNTFLAATTKYIGGYLFDQNWLDTIGKKSDQSKIICQMVGSEKDNAGACVIELMSKKLPQYVFNKVISGDTFYPNSSISFGSVPFDPDTDNKFTYIESKFKNKNLEIWGVDDNFENSKVTNLLKKTSSKENDVINVVVNTAVKKEFNLKINEEYPITFFQNLVKNNDNKLIEPFNTHINMERYWDGNNANLICVPGSSNSDCVSLNKDQKIGSKSSEWFPHYTYGIFNKNLTDPSYIEQVPLTVEDSISQKVMKNEYNIKQESLEKKIKVIGQVDQISSFKVYAKQQDINNLIFANATSPAIKDQKKLDTFKKIYFNAKFSKKYQLDDETNISFFNPYGDYTQQGLNGGKYNYPIFDDKGTFEKEKIDEYKAYSTSTVIDEWSHSLFFGKIYQIIGGFSLLFILFTVLIFLLSFVIMLSCCNILIHDNKKQILIMKSLGYKNKEINSVTTGIFFITIIFSFITTLIVSYVIGYFLVNEVLGSINWYISYWFIIISLFFTFLLLLSIYFTVRHFTIKSLNKLDMKQVLQK